MKLITIMTALAALPITTAQADTRVETLCGRDHVNEMASSEDVVANPDGYYIRSLKTQISHGDPRIIQATGKVFNYCTRSAATPDMSTNLALTLMGKREIRYLFVPTDCPKTRSTS